LIGQKVKIINISENQIALGHETHNNFDHHGNHTRSDQAYS